MKELILDRLFDRWFATGLGIVLALITGNAVLAYYNTASLYRATGEVTHTHDVILALEQVLSSAKDAETGQRGFLLTGDSAYLEPFESAVRVLGSQVDRLDKLIQDEPGQLQRMPFLRQRVREKLDELKLTIATRQSQGLDAARRIMLTGRGRVAMDQLRDLVQDMEAEAVRIRGERIAAARRYRLIAIGSGFFVAAVGLGLVLLLARLFKRRLTEGRVAAEALYDQKELLRTTVASIGDAVITTDAEGRLTFLNPVAEELTGWTTESAAGLPLDQVFHIVNEASRAKVANPAERALREGIIVGLANHTILIAKDGTEHAIDDSAAPILSSKGRIQGVVLVFRDVTEAKEAAQALRESDRRKDEFLAVLAHELRNPLAPLQNSLSILRLSQEPAVLQEVRGVMERQLQQMVRLMDDLMDVSRISRNALELRREPVPVASVVQTALEMSDPAIKEHRHKLTTSLPDEVVYIDADPARLTQALSNLLSNAAKYSQPGGHISLGIGVDDGQVVMAVKDTGIGIPSEMMERIFEMFVQVDRSLEGATSGLGIGLSLVRRIVELHGGTVAAKSDGAGKGSEFIIRLPRVPAPLTAATDGHKPRTAKARWRILVADDNQDAVESLAQVLRLLGHEVVTANDGEEALAKLPQFKPQVAVLDIGMPRLNGYDTARRIREHPDGRNVLLLALTGWGQEEDRQLTEAAGFARHLVKPLDARELDAMLGEMTTGDGR